MKNYSHFLQSLNEASGKNFIDVVDEAKPFGDVVTKIHRDNIIEELEEYFLAKENGYFSSLKVFADIPTSGSRKPAYLADVLPVVKRERTPDERPEGEEPADVNVFVDVEFEVIGIDKDNNKVIGMPVSLKRKRITTPIDPRDIMEVSFIKIKKPESPITIRKKEFVPDLPPAGGETPSIDQEF